MASKNLVKQAMVNFLAVVENHAIQNEIQGVDLGQVKPTPSNGNFGALVFSCEGIPLFTAYFTNSSTKVELSIPATYLHQVPHLNLNTLENPLVVDPNNTQRITPWLNSLMGV